MNRGECISRKGAKKVGRRKEEWSRAFLGALGYCLGTHLCDISGRCPLQDLSERKTTSISVMSRVRRRDHAGFQRRNRSRRDHRGPTVMYRMHAYLARRARRAEVCFARNSRRRQGGTGGYLRLATPTPPFFR